MRSGTVPPIWYVWAIRQAAAPVAMHQTMPSGSQRDMDVHPFRDATSARTPQRTTGASANAARTPRPNTSQFAAKSAMTPRPMRSAPKIPAIRAPSETFESAAA